MAEMKTYELLAGDYVERGSPGKRYHRDPKGPAVFVQSEDDLIEMFPGKFKIPDQPQPAPRFTPPPPASTVPPKVLDEVKVEEGNTERGKEVTEAFREATDNDLKVYQSGDGHSVWDKDEELVTGLKTKINVRSWLAQYLAGHKSDDQHKKE